MFRKYRHISILSFAVLAFSTSLSAVELAKPSEDKIDKTVLSIMENHGGIGTAIAVIKDGEPLFVKGYGMADLEHNTPVTRNTVFQSGSVGKMFTATAIMLLEKEGKLNLDDTLTKFFPSGPEAWKNISIRHMLSHRGGFARLYGPETAIWPLYGEMSDEAFVEGAGKPSLIFEPGSTFTYSNGGYILLGIIVKQVSGQFYGDYLKDKLFTPTGMNSAQVNQQRDVIQGRAQGYITENGNQRHAHYVGEYFSKTADGSLVFTIEDMIKWEEGLFHNSFLSEKALESMFTAEPYADGTTGVRKYGFGWDSYDMRGHRLAEHTGYWQGFSTYVARYPDDGFAVTVLTNAREGQPKLIAAEVAGLFNADYRPYKPLADQSTTPDMKRLTLAYLSGKFDKSRFSKRAKTDIAPKQVSRVRGEVKVEENPSFTLVAKRANNSETFYTYRFIGKMGRESAPIYFVTYGIEDSGKISSIKFQLGR